MKPKSIYKMILEGEDIRWQTVIYELVRSGSVDPWNLDISILTREFLKVLRNLERMNFHLSGKVVLAAAILLKLKTRELGLDEFVQHSEGIYEEPVEEIETEEEQAIIEIAKAEAPQLVSKIPQNKTRPVTVFELVHALKKAIVVEERRKVKVAELEEEKKPIRHNLKKIDIYKKICRVYNKICTLVQSGASNFVDFEDITHSQESKDKLWTFLPLLHLANEGKVDLHQEIPFGKIFVEMRESKAIPQESSNSP